MLIWTHSGHSVTVVQQGCCATVTYRKYWLGEIMENRPQISLHIFQTMIYVKKMREVFVIGSVLDKNLFGFSKFPLHILGICAQR
jgi:hypothetical protein